MPGITARTCVKCQKGTKNHQNLFMEEKKAKDWIVIKKKVPCINFFFKKNAYTRISSKIFSFFFFNASIICHCHAFH